MTAYSVRCGDYADFADPDEEWVVAGFASAALAQDYARRFVRAQIEDLRGETSSSEELQDIYYRFGEYAIAEGLDHKAWVAACIGTPATRKQDTDYAALEPR